MRSFIFLIACFCACLSFSQARGVAEAGKLAEMTDKLRYSSQEAVISFRQAMSKLDSAMDHHKRAKRDIESSYDINNIEKVPDSCRYEVQSKLALMKTQAVENYVKCSGGTIFNAVGDSVKIVSSSLQLFSQIFQSLDDLTNGFSDCYKSGVFHAITCTVEALDALGSDTKISVDLAETYGENITSLARDVSNIIAVCQHKKPSPTYLNISNLCSESNNDL